MDLRPLLRSHHEKPWGRKDLPGDLADGTRRIGEIWFDLADIDLMLLVKRIFTSERLSIQVHPDDALAKQHGLTHGKEEWWLVTAAEPGATLGLGTVRTISAGQLEAAALDGSLEHEMRWLPVSAGDWFHVPPGTIHAIGAGVSIVEIQQNSDVTYRLFDYGRQRELHLAAGIEACEAKPYDPGLSGRLGDNVDRFPHLLVAGAHFRIWSGTGIEALAGLPGEDLWIIPLHGTLALDGMRCSAADVLYGNPGRAIATDRVAASSDFNFIAAQATSTKGAVNANALVGA